MKQLVVNVLLLQSCEILSSPIGQMFGGILFLNL